MHKKVIDGYYVRRVRRRGEGTIHGGKGGLQMGSSVYGEWRMDPTS
jgi:hypothetical protein